VPVDHYENFPVASWLTPASLRPAVVAIYAFARSADDFADEGNAPPAERLAELDAYEACLDRIARGEMVAEPPFSALGASVRHHGLPIGLLRDLLSAFRQDVTKTRYADFAEVLDYCRRSANPIGRLLLHLYDRVDPDNLRYADAICTGLQLANFWQDVAVDWAKGRVYLPADDMLRFGVSERDIAEHRCDVRWQRLMGFQVARTRALLTSGRPLTTKLPWRLRLELKLVLAGGMRILDGIDAVHGDVFGHRPVLRPWDWAAMTANALVGE